MRITSIRVFQKRLPHRGGGLAVGDRGTERARTFDSFTSTVVIVDTDAGLSGCGESCPWGPGDPGALPALPALSRALLGHDPRETHAIERIMEATLEGQTYAKSALDMACWDILGKSAGLPVSTLLGGRLCDGAPLYRCVMEQEPDRIRAEIEQYRAAGYRFFKLRVGIVPERDIELIRLAAGLARPGETVYADANGRWTLQEALAVARAVEDLGLMIEQPCATYGECLHFRARTRLPMKLDELVTDHVMAERLTRDGIAEVACVKMARVGGLSKARRIRDYLVAHGISVVPECMMGGEIVSAAVAHLAASTPAERLFNTTDLHAYNTESTGTPPPPTADGRLYCRDTPGLGVEPQHDSLGDPVAVFG